MISRNEKYSDRQCESWKYEFEGLIKSGQSSKATEAMAKIERDLIPRPYLFQFADLMRRASNPLLGLQLISKIVRSKELPIAPCTPEELIVYATCLTSIGCHLEAIEILKKIDVKLTPEADLYLAFAYFGLWKYAESIPVLMRFIDCPAVNPQKALVGKVNLIASYIALGFYEKAQVLIFEALESATRFNHKMLIGNIYELQAQMFFFQRQYLEAKQSLLLARDLLKETGIYFAYVQKWLVILELFNCQSSDAERLQELQREIQVQIASAIENKYWEVHRDLELFLNIVIGDRAAMTAVLAATPYEEFRRRAEKIFGFPIRKEDLKYLRKFPKNILRTTKVTHEIPIYLIWNGNNFRKFLRSPLIFKALQILVKDGFRPLSLGELFSSIYSDQYFDPFSSPKRVHNLIYRLRQILKSQKWPIEICASEDEFFIRPTQLNVVIVRETELMDSFACQYQRLFGKFKGRRIRIREVAECLNLSKRSAQLFLKIAIDTQLILKLGKGRSTRYQFKSDKNNSEISRINACD